MFILIFLLITLSNPSKVVFRDEENNIFVNNNITDDDLKVKSTVDDVFNALAVLVLNTTEDDREPKILDREELFVRKCCNEGEVLNMWHSCQQTGINSSELQDSLSNIAGRDLNILFEFNFLHCHRKMMQEFLPLKLYKNGSFLTDLGPDGDEMMESYHCIEFVEYFGEIEVDPSVVVCDLPEKVGQLNKCCPRDEILNEDMKTCIANPWTESIGDELLPARMMSDARTYKPTGGYHLKISNFSHLCEDKIFAVVPEQFYTNGLLTTKVDGLFQMLEYGCADMALKDGDVTDVVALICQEHVDVVVNKCCPHGEVFLFDGEVDGHCTYSKDYWSLENLNVTLQVNNKIPIFLSSNVYQLSYRENIWFRMTILKNFRSRKSRSVPSFTI